MERKEKTYKKTVADLQKKYGSGIISIGGMKPAVKVPTGILSIDRLMAGGIPRSKWTMIFGQKSTCKTSLCKRMVGIMQDKDEETLVIDAENTWDPDYAMELGMDPDKCHYSKPDTIEEILTMIEDFAPHMGLIVVDSITSISPEQEMKRDLEQDTIALIPRQLSKFFRRATPIVGKSNCMVIMVNQVRMNLQGHYAFEDYPGGNALAHYCHFIMHTMRGAKSDAPQREIVGPKGNTITADAGFQLKLKVEKTKISKTEGRTALLNFYYDPPYFSPEDDLFRVGLIEGAIEKSGAWYNVGEKKAQGESNFIDLLKEDKKLFNKIKKELEND